MKLKETALQNEKITEWLLNRDPSIRWQVMRDFICKSEIFFN